MKKISPKIIPLIFLLSFLVIFSILLIENQGRLKPIPTNTPVFMNKPTLPTSPTPQNTGLNYSSQLSFPGAEGYGSESIGGRKGKIIEVTNLNDSGPGSLRAAIEQPDPRIIVFTLGGTIELDSSLEIIHPYITIAGQTAPGDGITLKNSNENMFDTLIISTHDVIIRYIRSRPGPPNEISSNGDALEILGPEAFNIIIDHCSFSWGIDEVVSTWYDAHDITIQWSIISEGLNCSLHAKGCHGMGLLLGSDGSRNISIHHNLFAHNVQRNPLIQTSGMVDFINNVIYHTGFTPITINDNYGVVKVNIIGNYLKQIDSDNDFLLSVNGETGNGIEIFLMGNITPSRNNDNLPDDLVVKNDGRKWLVSSQIESAYITTTKAIDAYDQVLLDAGSSKYLSSLGTFIARRDSVDTRIINDVRNSSGDFIDNPLQVGGWPDLSEGKSLIDSDHDGMPDDWELKFGLDHQNPTDSSMDFDKDGYTNVEEFLNSTDPLG